MFRIGGFLVYSMEPPTEAKLAPSELTISKHQIKDVILLGQLIPMYTQTISVQTYIPTPIRTEKKQA
jgi:hypothetical protein